MTGGRPSTSQLPKAETRRSRGWASRAGIEKLFTAPKPQPVERSSHSCCRIKQPGTLLNRSCQTLLKCKMLLGKPVFGRTWRLLIVLASDFWQVKHQHHV